MERQFPYGSQIMFSEGMTYFSFFLNCRQLACILGLSEKKHICCICMFSDILFFKNLDGSYGTGAIMAVPAHDTRDYEFASKYDIPIQWVVKSDIEDDNSLGKAYPGDGIIVNSSSLVTGLDINGLSSKEAASKVIHWAEQTGNGKKKVCIVL